MRCEEFIPLSDFCAGALVNRAVTHVVAPVCGKTLFATEFLVHGALRFGEPGVLIAFEETADELGSNVASLGFDLPRLVRQKKTRAGPRSY